jgi:methylmalonyl-CoA/ethylmalonyl-CoA epimerase
MIRRLDHVAILVADTDVALCHFRDRLGLRVAYSEEIAFPPARLTYLDAGNAYLQLVQPISGSGPLADALRSGGEGLHHLCFGVDDVPADACALGDHTEPSIGGGRGRRSAFAPGPVAHGVRLECTEFRRREDVDATPGWLSRE